MWDADTTASLSPCFFNRFYHSMQWRRGMAIANGQGCHGVLFPEYFISSSSNEVYSGWILWQKSRNSLIDRPVL